jgi:uncharacterized membrane protein YfcA
MSGVLVPLMALLVSGLAAGFAAGLFGIGGGFVVVPALMAVLPLLGGTKAELAHVAIGTSAATIIVTALRSTHAHAKRGAVDFDVLKSWAPWLVLGSAAGVLLAARVSGAGLVVIFGTGVVLMSIHFLFPVLAGRQISDTMPGGAVRMGIAGGLGTFSSMLGIGGGTIAIIVMTLCGKSIHKAIATAAGIGVLIGVPTALGFALIGLGAPAHDLPWGSLGYVNMPATVAISAMTLVSAPWGVAAAHKLNPVALRTIFGIYLLVLGISMMMKGLHG